MSESMTFASYEPTGNAEKPEVTINIKAKVPDDVTAEWFAGQASDLAYCLIFSLPQGTLSRLTALLMTHEANKSMLINKDEYALVAFGKAKP